MGKDTGKIEFKHEEYLELLNRKNNEYLNEPAEKKYEEFYRLDPFPQIPGSLLNATDILKYVTTVGMIDPFYSEDLAGATYTCKYSGKYKYWDESGKEKKSDNDGEELKLPPNSITFLEIEPIFRIPEYIILRFNLNVKHVFKGLLLGTGPIVDPGFQGRLYIPLHNLTSNEYIIKKNAPLISVEFTKLSRNYANKLNDYALIKMTKGFDFKHVPYIYRRFKKRDLNKYIESALCDDDRTFYKNKDLAKAADYYSIASSIPESIKKAEQDAKESKQTVEKLTTQTGLELEKIRIDVKHSEDKLSFAVILTFMLAFVPIIIAVMALVHDSSALVNDLNIRVEELLTDYEKAIEDYEKLYNSSIELEEKNIEQSNIISTMQDEITGLKNQINEIQLKDGSVDE